MRELFNCTESLDEKEEQQHYIWNDTNDIANDNKANTDYKSDQKMLNSTVLGLRNVTDMPNVSVKKDWQIGLRIWEEKAIQ